MSYTAFPRLGKKMRRLRMASAAQPAGKSVSTHAGWLTGQLLVAMPTMSDQRFARTVIYLCSHTPDGAMGLVINRLYADLNFRGLLSQLNITLSLGAPDLSVHYGGPVEPGRGFVLHTTDYLQDSSLKVNETTALTATVEILQALADGKGPEKALLALGYAGWGAGQLDAELQTNGWLIAPADDHIIFGPHAETKWEQALAKIGISPMVLSGEIGHA